MRKIFTSILLMISAVSLNAATYYKWNDPNGVPHYSQFAPTNGVDLKKVQVINTREAGSPAMAATATASGAVASTPMTPEQKKIAELEAQNKAQQQQRDKERCKDLQNSLANLNTGGRLYEIDNKGERKYLDGREIELKRQKLAQLVSQYCK